MNKMVVVYAGEKLPQSLSKSIFLAGPTPRDEEVFSWRKQALEILYNMDYDGVVFVPEPRNGTFDTHSEANYKNQVEWEELCLNAADRILFWVPRKMANMPGLTTNDEFGVWKRSTKVVFGAPVDAQHVRYQQYYCEKYNVPMYNNLYIALSKCVTDLLDGTLRIGGERLVPLHIYNHPAFIEWYHDLKTAGNRLDDAKVLWSFSPNGKNTFCFALWTKIWIASENRHKDNEFVFGIPHISSCMLYHRSPNDDLLNTKIVFVEEFRSPVSNRKGMVCELPGGSSVKPDTDPVQNAIEEVYEETGIRINASKLEFNGVRQLQATTLSHKCYLYSYELDEVEMLNINKNIGNIHGNAQDTEMCYLRVYSLRELLAGDLVDWSTIGMVTNVIFNKL